MHWPTRLNFEKLLIFDDRTSRQLRLDEKYGFRRRIAVFFAHSGDSWFWMIGLGLIWLFGSPVWHAHAMLLAIGVGGLALAVFAIKFLIRRPRPAGEWGAIYRNTDPHSFPSGHAARMALLATMAIGLGPAWFAIMMILWAPAVSLARVMMGVHYLSDILAGTLVGIAAGALMFGIQPLLITYFHFLF